VARNMGTHWRAQTLMICAFVGRVLLSLGHDLFYSRFNGTTAPYGYYHLMRSQVSQQQTNVAIGTALAFLVKVSLVLASAVAFFQIFWKEVNNARKSITINRLDAMDSAIHDVLALVNPVLWLRVPALVSVAFVAW
jgi:hypothetical protein